MVRQHTHTHTHTHKHIELSFHTTTRYLLICTLNLTDMLVWVHIVQLFSTIAKNNMLASICLIIVLFKLLIAANNHCTCVSLCISSFTFLQLIWLWSHRRLVHSQMHHGNVMLLRQNIRHEALQKEGLVCLIPL